MEPLLQTQLSLPLLHSGKVRDIFDINEEMMLIVATDRLSAFDVVFNQPILEKGKILTSVANYWFNKTEHIVPNHLTKVSLEEVLSKKEAEQLKGRAIVVKKLKPLPIEAVVRGYLIGSGWKEYVTLGSLCNIPLPTGLKLAQKLERPLYTPSSKAPAGEHDTNISLSDTKELLGEGLAVEVKERSLEIYKFAFEHAISRGIIIADTKFEFGIDEKNKLVLIDELLTPDSSRFWPVESYKIDISPPSFDKQYVRDYLDSIGWNHNPPPPHLPEDIVKQTSAKYREALERFV